jgi:hypothetical protein
MQIRPAIARSMITGRKSGLCEFGFGKDYSLSFDSNGRHGGVFLDAAGDDL